MKAAHVKIFIHPQSNCAVAAYGRVPRRVSSQQSYFYQLTSIYAYSSDGPRLLNNTASDGWITALVKVG
jgi:hypothetical protein